MVLMMVCWWWCVDGVDDDDEDEDVLMVLFWWCWWWWCVDDDVLMVLCWWCCVEMMLRWWCCVDGVVVERSAAEAEAEEEKHKTHMAMWGTKLLRRHSLAAFVNARTFDHCSHAFCLILCYSMRFGPSKVRMCSPFSAAFERVRLTSTASPTGVACSTCRPGFFGRSFWRDSKSTWRLRSTGLSVI